MKVNTPSRLHLGIIDMSREFIREYGAVGLMIEGGYRIGVEGTEGGIEVKGSKKEKREVRAVYKKMKKHFGFERGFSVDIKRSVPRHIGLGSTTQLHLGTATGMARELEKDIELIELAKIVERARYSAIGTYGFKRGGFILEGGKATHTEVPPLMFSMSVPSHWRFIVVSPKEAEGYDEVEERPIMEEARVDIEYPRRISHHIIMGLLPAIRTDDIEDFGYHLTEIQRLVGRSFAEHQGGVYHPAVSDIIERLNEMTYGAGQSSWGPTAYGVTSEKRASKQKKKISDWLAKEGKKCYVWVAKPNNRGATFSAEE